jgi:hypothetical protein
MKTKLAAAILTEVVLLLTVSLAQQSSPIADPEAERILDKAAQAEGGDNVLGTLRTLRLTGSMYVGSHRFGDVEFIIKFPDKFRDTFQNVGGHTLRYGFDGAEAWKQLTAEERSSGLPSLQLLLPAAQWRLRYAEARFVGQRKIGNRQAYVVRALVRGQTSPADYYYDPVNYLLLRVETAPETLATIYLVSRFQDIDGLKVPREWSLDENRTVISSIKLNIDIDDKQFAKPK